MPPSANSPIDPAMREFVTLLTESQIRIYGYILSLVADRDAARDILQNTNLVLWEKAAEYRPGSGFIAWAFAIARYEVLARRRDTARERLVFDEALMTRLGEEWAAEEPGHEGIRDALVDCMGKLPTEQRELVSRRYRDDQSIQTLAAPLGRSANAVAKQLHRIRLALLACIERSMASDHGGAR